MVTLSHISPHRAAARWPCSYTAVTLPRPNSTGAVLIELDVEVDNDVDIVLEGMKRWAIAAHARIQQSLISLVNFTRTLACWSPSCFHTLSQFSTTHCPGTLQSSTLQPFINLAISNINQAGYRKSYRVPVLAELANVKEREHDKHVVQAAKFVKYLYFSTALPRRGHACTQVSEYCTVPVPDAHVRCSLVPLLFH